MYVSPGVYMQRRVGGGGGGGECAAYPKPLPTAVVTDLTIVPIIQSASAVVTNLCAEVS